MNWANPNPSGGHGTDETRAPSAAPHHSKSSGDVALDPRDVHITVEAETPHEGRRERLHVYEDGTATVLRGGGGFSHVKRSLQ